MREREIKTWQNRNHLLRLMVDRSMDHCHFAKTLFCRSGWDGANVVTTDVTTKTWAVGLGTASAGDELPHQALLDRRMRITGVTLWGKTAVRWVTLLNRS